MGQRRPLLLIAGMHRSGTSLLASRLVESGLHVGDADDLMPANDKSNARGHWELRSVARLNDDLLAEVGAHWSAPIAFEPSTMAGLADGPLGDRARELLETELAGVDFVKDPRLCLTLPFWGEVLGPSPALIVPWRHPFEVAASLRERNSFPEAFGLELWREYHRRLCDSARGLDRLVVAHADHLAEPESTLTAVCGFIEETAGLETTLPRSTPDMSIVHHREGAEVPGWATDLIEAIRADGQPESVPDNDPRWLAFGALAPVAIDRDRVRSRLHALRASRTAPPER